MMRSDEDQSRLSIGLNGEELIADLSGGLLWPRTKTLIVSDLHLEKGSHFARLGQPLPPYDSDETLVRLAAVIERTEPERVVCLGDSFHDAAASFRLSQDNRARLAAMAAGRDWLWVLGNHDPDGAGDLIGRSVTDIVEGGLVLRHEAEPGAIGEISGHYHPKATVRVRTGRISGRCFVTDGKRLILPAFGAYTGGLSVRDPAIAGLMDRSASILLIGERRLFTLPITRG